MTHGPDVHGPSTSGTARGREGEVSGRARRVRPAPRRKGLYADCLRTYLEVVAKLPHGRMLDRILLRTASRRGVDLMALSVTDARLRYRDLLEHVNTPHSDWKTLVELSRGAIAPSAVARIARVVALQEIEPDDRANALALLRWLSAQCGAQHFDRDERRLFQNLAFVEGDYALAAELVNALDLSRTDTLVMRADLANPWGPSPYADRTVWQSRFSKLFERHRVEAPAITTESGGAGEAFDGLQCQVGDAIADGPLVSVIMTCWQPGAELALSLRSILDQTWRNLEILLVDDASPPAYQEVLARAQEMDLRIRLLKQPENGGTYVARNAALAAARGEFVTGQDSDDWSHPRRIEKQVTKMLAEAKLVSTTSHALRCDPSMLFVAPGMLARRENASSLMFRREAAIQNAGYYDATRKGGDTEYMLRLQRVFGQHSHHLLESDLALIRRSRASLSHAEFRPGWRHPARSAYRRSYEFWHQTESAPDALRLDGRMDSPRRFPLPRRFVVRRDSQQTPDRYDVVFIDDFRPGANVRDLRAMCDEIRCLITSGLRVGLAHLRSFRDISFDSIDSYWPPIAEAIHEGTVDEVLLTDTLDVDTVVVRRPEVALFFSPIGVALRPAKVIVVAEEPFRQPDGRVWYEPVACQRNLRDAFDAPVEWAAAPRVERELVATLPPHSAVGRAYPIVVDAQSWRYPARGMRDRPPIVGCIAGSSAGGRQSAPFDLLAALPADSGIRVRIMSAEDDSSAVEESSLPANWSLVRGDADPEVFLGGCDFLVCLDCVTGDRRQKRLFSQAMASGCVVITSPECADAYRGVTSCRIDDLRARIGQIWQDEASYRAHVEQGFGSVRKHDGSQRRQAELVARIGRQAHAPAKNIVIAGGGVEPGKVDAPGVARVVEEHVISYRSRGFLREIDRTILRTGSLEGRDILAHMASRGGLDWTRMRAMLSEYRAGHRVTRTRRVFGELDPRFARRLGRVVALQALLPDDRMSALTLFKALIDAQGVRALDPQHGKLALDLAFHLRDWAFLERHRRELPAHESARRFVELDLHNPFIGSPFANHDRWLELLNQHYLEAGIAPLELEAVDSAAAPVPFDRLSTGPVAAVEDGDLVTVVMSSWQPDDSLVYAMRSVTKQTWRNLEILLIDDASPDEFTPLLESVAASDPRIRLIRQPFNAGTYVARNRGMKEAKGRYFTVHDSDDWAHPQRIERQVAALQRDSRLVSSGSFAFRCDDNLVVNLPGVLPDRENASSLTFELEKVRARIGYFDESRKGADTEYVLRMRAAFGEDSHHVLGEPLAMIRLRPDSLSRAEFKPGWRHPARAMYRRGYEAWHRRIRHDPAGAYLPSPLRQRPFNLPARFQVERAASRFGDRGQGYDIVFAADFRASAGLDRSICHEIRLARQAGLKTGLLHMESFWHASLREIEPFDPDVEQWLHDKFVDEVLYTDDYRIGLLVIRDPSVLQFPQPRASTLGVEGMLVVAGAIGEGEDGCAPFDPGDCANNAFAMFGIEPRWCARGEGGAAALAANLSSRHVVPQRWPDSVLEFADIPRAGRDPASHAIIGAIVPSGNVDPVVEWWSALGEATASASLRVLGPHGSSGITAPASVTVEPGWTPRLAFLAGCDFYTDFPVTVPDASRHRWIVEAMAQGCIPVVSGQWRQIFGDAVEYCLPDDLPARVLELARDPERLAQARARAHAWVRAHHDPQPLYAFWSLAGAKQDAGNIEAGAHAAADDASAPLAHASGSA